MTTPTTTQAPPQQPQRQPPSDHDLTAAILAALGAYFTAQGLTRALSAPFKAAGISGAALAAVASLVASWPHEVMEGTGPATRWAVRANLARRAGFFLAASRRTQEAIKAARARDEPIRAALQQALATEGRYMAMHIAANQKRISAASAVDGAAAMHGPLLGWNAVLDSRTTAECRAANGKTFHADRPPLIGYPGTVHSRCRCWPGAARPGAPILP